MSTLVVYVWYLKIYTLSFFGGRPHSYSAAFKSTLRDTTMQQNCFSSHMFKIRLGKHVHFFVGTVRSPHLCVGFLFFCCALPSADRPRPVCRAHVSFTYNFITHSLYTHARSTESHIIVTHHCHTQLLHT